MEKAKQDSLKESKITIDDRPKETPNEESTNDNLKSTSPSPISDSNSNLNPQPEINSPNSIPSSHTEESPPESPEEITEVITPNSQLEESQPVTTQPVTTQPTQPIEIKNYKTFNLVLRNETKSPDGFSRYVYTINNQFPGPELIVDKGDTIRINITNYIGKPTSIHVHGMIHKETVYMDGVPYVTQCPIQNGSSFTYEFDATHPGTYW